MRENSSRFSLTTTMMPCMQALNIYFSQVTASEGCPANRRHSRRRLNLGPHRPAGQCEVKQLCERYCLFFF